MNDFLYDNQQLMCEKVPVSRIAEEVGTPFYLYSYATLRNHFRVFKEAFADVPHMICFAVKANSNLAVLKVFIDEGGGVDIVSGGELFRALSAGVDPGKVVYSGVGKRVDEIEYALRSNILMFNVESWQELEVINQCAQGLGLRAGIALRVNPDVDPKTHPHISTGLKENKFGIDIERSLETYRLANSLKHVDIKGVSCHIGSQVTRLSPFVEALDRLSGLVRQLKEEGFDIRYIDLGGGLGITYDSETPPHPSEYAEAVLSAARDLDCTFIFEPGRVIVGNAGILVTKVLYTKSTDNKNFIIVDAGMNDLVRPSLYNSFHAIRPVALDNRKEIVADVVGPICESGDYLAKARKIASFERGDLLAVFSAGAYGFTMASNYNSRPRIPEIMVREDRYHIIRKRETYADLISHEEIPPFLIKQPG
ncbi:MAG: Diaminopimelate decarboxylase [Syntrophus sp. PtaU1.Bin005]|jgi:diaminopimelate decarboxylase|uniref:diaminopimelate decarboxylase n=1 Tax=Syntrophus TaxID=43773 RepID=UPI0009CBB8C5|nr:MAG: Diaminopimelate decarboxylase [Syntrophus sp. PtaB.Bin138]OPY83751.1 MAG: Diaminopimelate decarboxylase [Syntrophus sp. PtaU1.Bin005]